MLARDRRNEILKLLSTNGGVIKMTEIIKEFGVSHETARRDLEALQDKNYVRRISGGAILNSKMKTLDFSIASNIDERGSEERAIIGRVAATLINEGESILLANGTTVLEVARNLKKFHNLTIITNSLPVINELIGTGFEIIVLGGVIDNNELNMSGQLSVRAIKSLYVDKAFIGAGGITLEYGISDYSLQDADMREEIVKHARTTILVAHSEKFGANAFSVGLALNQIDTIVTDSGLDKDLEMALTDMGIAVMIANMESKDNH